MKSIWNKEELPDQWKESIIVPVHKKRDTQMKLLGIMIVGFSVTNQLLIRTFAFVR
jgi:hypothetical protein